MKHARATIKVETVFAGKIRRYYGTNLMRQLIDLPTLGHNLFDIFLVMLGFVQSFIKLIRWRPQVIFCKGGFVCLPVGMAARILRIPLVIHDSDAHPGLTNRLLAPGARAIATGAPLEYYNYPNTKAHYTGIPVKPEFRRYSPAEKAHIKSLFHLPNDQPLLVIVGGSLGAKRINDAMVAIAPELIRHVSVIHISGTRQYHELKRRLPEAANYKLLAFLSDHFAQLIGTADVVVARAGASSTAELAAVGASLIIVPNGQLVGGHQLKNAKVYLDAGAAMLADETLFMNDPQLLLKHILELVNNDQLRHSLSAKLHEFAKPEAAKEVADLVMQAGGL
jgi:UDP-N-acetylglucosamine--N-acetylmuramyl-(pentapeptide) pyrophosphoryl-undecaprenol N-acetylglucosamine transferase